MKNLPHRLKKTPPNHYVMNKNKFINISLEDQITIRDRWVLFLMILMMAAIAWTAYEINEVKKEYSQKQENLSVNSGFEHAY